MTRAFGTRALFSVILPATNAVVEPDPTASRPPGVTSQSCRFPFPRRPGAGDEPVGLVEPARSLLCSLVPGFTLGASPTVGERQ